MKGQIVHSPSGERVVLDDVGQKVLLDNDVVPGDWFVVELTFEA